MKESKLLSLLFVRLSLHCCPPSRLVKFNWRRKMKRHSHLSIALLLLVALSSVSCGPLGSVIGARETDCIDDPSESTPRTAAAPPNSRLVRCSPEGSGLSLELPGEPRPFEIAMPEDVRRSFQEVKAYTYNDSHLLVFLCRYRCLRSPVTSRQLRDLSAGFIDSFKNSGFPASDYSREPKSPCEILMRGSLRQHNVPVRFEGFARGKEGSAWIMVATYAPRDAAAYALAHYVVESVKLE